MLVEGPLNLTLITDDGSVKRELHVKFAQSFQALSLEQRSHAMRDYVTALQKAVTDIDNDAEKQGMLTVLSFAEQVLPFIENDDMELGETIIIEIQSDFSITNLLH